MKSYTTVTIIMLHDTMRLTADRYNTIIYSHTI